MIHASTDTQIKKAATERKEWADLGLSPGQDTCMTGCGIFIGIGVFIGWVFFFIHFLG